MQGKILSFETYLMMLPYGSYWPQVYELRYEPTPAEFGKAPRLGVHRGPWLTFLPLQKVDGLVELDCSNGKKRRVPVAAMLEMENQTFEAYGVAEYKKRVEGLTVFHLVLERGGERLADYLCACLTRKLPTPILDLLLFGDEAPPARHAEPTLCTLTGDAQDALRMHTLRPAQEIHAARFGRDLQGFIDDVKCAIGELLQARNPALSNGHFRPEISVRQNTLDPTQFDFEVKAPGLYGKFCIENPRLVQEKK